MPSSSAEAKFQQLKNQILELGFVRPGSLVRRYMPCGNPSCRCMATPPHLHGPYYQWSWKTGGRTSSVSLSAEQAALCRQWVKLEGIIKRMRILSQRAARPYEIRQK